MKPGIRTTGKTESNARHWSGLITFVRNGRVFGFQFPRRFSIFNNRTRSTTAETFVVFRMTEHAPTFSYTHTHTHARLALTTPKNRRELRNSSFFGRVRPPHHSSHRNCTSSACIRFYFETVFFKRITVDVRRLPAFS